MAAGLAASHHRALTITDGRAAVDFRIINLDETAAERAANRGLILNHYVSARYGPLSRLFKCVGSEMEQSAY